jgi:hypothetical protein
MTRTTGAIGDPYLATWVNDLTGPAQNNRAKYALVSYSGAGTQSMKIYKNGTLQNSSTVLLNTNNTPFVLGADGNVATADYLDGYIADVMVFDRDITIGATAAQDLAVINAYIAQRYNIQTGNVPTLTAWFDSRLLNTLSNNDSVTSLGDIARQWTDPLTPAGGTDPKYLTAGINSKPSIHFTSDQLGQSGNNARGMENPAAAAHPFWMAAVVKLDAASGTNNVLGGVYDGANGIYFNASAGGVRQISVAGVTTLNGGASTANAEIWMVRVAGSTITFYVNGSSVGTVVANYRLANNGWPFVGGGGNNKVSCLLLGGGGNCTNAEQTSIEAQLTSIYL